MPLCTWLKYHIAGKFRGKSEKAFMRVKFHGFKLNCDSIPFPVQECNAVVGVIDFCKRVQMSSTG